MRSQVSMDPSTRGESSDSHGASNGSQNESKLELFGFDSLVNILGLKRYQASTLYYVFFSFLVDC